MAGFYAAVVLYSDAWQQLARAAGDVPPWPGAPAEWTADQCMLWALHREYRSIAEAAATADDQLPEAEILEDPDQLREWFRWWMEERRRRQNEPPGTHSVTIMG